MLKISIKNLSSGQFLALGYILVIAAGTILLLLPISTAGGRTTTFMEALFTATSATAVTGLIVVNTAKHWTNFGRFTIMMLIQLGGFGFMTSTTLILLILGRRVSLRNRLIIMEDINYKEISGVIALTKYIIVLTFLIETGGSFLLFMSLKEYYSLGRAAFYSVFHAISAFNNAGFDLFGNSLEGFSSSLFINSLISLLIILGGIGFVVIDEIYQVKRLNKLSLHSKVVIYITVLLIITGMGAIYILEDNNPATIGNMNLKNRLLASFFQSVTTRTTGFNTIPIAHFNDVTLFLMIILMFIGASPGSTAGGIKTTTFGTLMAVVYNMAAGKKDIEIFNRRLKNEDVYKALTVVIISLLLVAVVTMILSRTEDFSFIQILFEVVSAFGTVGLSTGITPDLSSIGRLFIIITMFIGRVGPFTLALALGKRYIKEIRYPEEDLLIG
ncbi:MAG: TrkH family potassium uptake protein [Halanaerobiaceae bacterium]